MEKRINIINVEIEATKVQQSLKILRKKLSCLIKPVNEQTLIKFIIILLNKRQQKL